MSQTSKDVAICALSQLSDPGSREFAVGEGDWPLRGFIVRKGAQVFAYVNRCPHAGHPLNRSPDGFLAMNDQWIMCRSHGAVFDIESGLCVAGICSGRSLQKLPVHVREGVVSLEYDDALQRWI